MPAVLFLLRAVVLILMWGLVLAAILAVRHDFLGTRARATPAPKPARAAPAPTTERPPKPVRKDRSAARLLVVTAGPLAGTSLKLDTTPITIGRADSSTLVIADDYVSTNQAR
jgi:hypothetical protein